jgi:hypothetical protein
MMPDFYTKLFRASSASCSNVIMQTKAQEKQCDGADAECRGQAVAAAGAAVMAFSMWRVLPLSTCQVAAMRLAVMPS